MNTTCITLLPKTTQQDFVFVAKGPEASGCYSSVGRQGRRQVGQLTDSLTFDKIGWTNTINCIFAYYDVNEMHSTETWYQFLKLIQIVGLCKSFHLKHIGFLMINVNHRYWILNQDAWPAMVQLSMKCSTVLVSIMSNRLEWFIKIFWHELKLCTKLIILKILETR